MSIYLFTYLSSYLAISFCSYLSLYLYFFISIYLSISFHICTSSYLSIYLFSYLSIYSPSPPVALSLSLSLSLSFFCGINFLTSHNPFSPFLLIILSLLLLSLSLSLSLSFFLPLSQDEDISPDHTTVNSSFWKYFFSLSNSFQIITPTDIEFFFFLPLQPSYASQKKADIYKKIKKKMVPVGVGQARQIYSSP
ncbi:unnamed protein product [Acanthosepion pharaonis]|uniref:Uncharacterized protein n=1 Tax=Acanthosepion pharaonis TaxID=158019 RepID=A0A812BSC0_ACAPH|nr:unnamed protein product [Sepia pharaonis]